MSKEKDILKTTVPSDRCEIVPLNVPEICYPKDDASLLIYKKSIKNNNPCEPLKDPCEISTDNMAKPNASVKYETINDTVVTVGNDAVILDCNSQYFDIIKNNYGQDYANTLSGNITVAANTFVVSLERPFDQQTFEQTKADLNEQALTYAKMNIVCTISSLAKTFKCFAGPDNIYVALDPSQETYTVESGEFEAALECYGSDDVIRCIGDVIENLEAQVASLGYSRLECVYINKAAELKCPIYDISKSNTYLKDLDSDYDMMLAPAPDNPNHVGYVAPDGYTNMVTIPEGTIIKTIVYDYSEDEEAYLTQWDTEVYVTITNELETLLSSSLVCGYGSPSYRLKCPTHSYGAGLSAGVFELNANYEIVSLTIGDFEAEDNPYRIDYKLGMNLNVINRTLRFVIDKLHEQLSSVRTTAMASLYCYAYNYEINAYCDYHTLQKDLNMNPPPEGILTTTARYSDTYNTFIPENLDSRIYYFYRNGYRSSDVMNAENTAPNDNVIYKNDDVFVDVETGVISNPDDGANIERIALVSASVNRFTFDKGLLSEPLEGDDGTWENDYSKNTMVTDTNEYIFTDINLTPAIVSANQKAIQQADSSISCIYSNLGYRAKNCKQLYPPNTVVDVCGNVKETYYEINAPEEVEVNSVTSIKPQTADLLAATISKSTVVCGTCDAVGGFSFSYTPRQLTICNGSDTSTITVMTV